jgi:HSP20 family protein
MARERDPFVDFERMRREMDEFLGGLWGRPRPGRRGGMGFAPRVDVYYCGDPPKAIIKADLAGIELSAVSIEISGRALVISGERAMQETEGRVYQQIEIDSGRFRRIIELTADVDPERAKATYDDGILRVELPLTDREERLRQVPIERTGE